MEPIKPPNPNRQLTFPIVDAILCDAVISPFDASGGRKSRGRTMLLKILEKRTREEVSREIGCSAEFVSLMASGQRTPSRWELIDRIATKLRIPRPAWKDHEGSPLGMTIADKQLQAAEFERYERSRIAELQLMIAEHEERLAEVIEEQRVLARAS